MSKQYYMLRKIIETFLNNNKTNKDITRETKQTIISLAYTDSLSSSDILELSEILLTISKYKTPDKKKGL